MIYSINAFRNDMRKLAEENNETYFAIELRMDNTNKFNFRGYINGFDWHEGETPQEVVRLLRQEKLPPIEMILEVKDKTNEPT